jgi:hypothetical protein
MYRRAAEVEACQSVIAQHVDGNAIDLQKVFDQRRGHRGAFGQQVRIDLGRVVDRIAAAAGDKLVDKDPHARLLVCDAMRSMAA